MKKFAVIKALLLALLLPPFVVRAAEPFFVHDGDRVAFLGDSITEQRLYTTYLEGYILSRFPDWKLTFRNVGWGGDTAWLRARANSNGDLLGATGEAQQHLVAGVVGRGLARDVLPLQPTAVTIDFGMNDHGYQPFNASLYRLYVCSQTELVHVLKQHGARVALLTPQPLEDRRPDPDQDVRNQSLRKFSDGLKPVAATEGAAFADQFDPYLRAMLQARAKDPQAFIGGGDAIHPGPPGHMLMAWAILKGLGASADVSRAEVEAVAQKIVVADHCRIENLKITNNSVSFDRLDDCLPLPVAEAAVPALGLAPVLEDLSRYTLKVTGLTGARYQLLVDGAPTATFTRAELTSGVNLTMVAGPITAQGRELLNQIVAKNNLWYHRWREVQLYDPPAWVKGPETESRRVAELARLDVELAKADAALDPIRKPKPHHFELKPI